MDVRLARPGCGALLTGGCVVVFRWLCVRGAEASSCFSDGLMSGTRLVAVHVQAGFGSTAWSNVHRQEVRFVDTRWACHMAMSCVVVVVYAGVRNCGVFGFTLTRSTVQGESGIYYVMNNDVFLFGCGVGRHVYLWQHVQRCAPFGLSF